MNVQLTRGDDLLIKFVIKEKETGLPLILTGYNYFTLTAKPNKNMSDTANGVIQIKLEIPDRFEWLTVNESQGIILLHISAEENPFNSVRKYFYDCQIEKTSTGNVITIANAILEVVQDITLTANF